LPFRRPASFVGRLGIGESVRRSAPVAEFDRHPPDLPIGGLAEFAVDDRGTKPDEIGVRIALSGAKFRLEEHRGERGIAGSDQSQQVGGGHGGVFDGAVEISEVAEQRRKAKSGGDAGFGRVRRIECVAATGLDLRLDPVRLELPFERANAGEGVTKAAVAASHPRVVKSKPHRLAPDRDCVRPPPFDLLPDRGGEFDCFEIDATSVRVVRGRDRALRQPESTAVGDPSGEQLGSCRMARPSRPRPSTSSGTGGPHTMPSHSPRDSSASEGEMMKEMMKTRVMNLNVQLRSAGEEGEM
jgi:hypothetical protein